MPQNPMSRAAVAPGGQRAMFGSDIGPFPVPVLRRAAPQATVAGLAGLFQAVSRACAAVPNA